MIRIKGFDKNLMCRDVPFEVGKEYKIESTNLELCTDTVFHYCKNLKQVAEHYPVSGEHRFCYIEVLGEEICDDDDEKCGSNHIKIVKEIVGEELDLMLGKINGNTGKWNTGKWNTGNSNTGNSNAGDSNTGYKNPGSGNTGSWNTGYGNTGSCNDGDINTGYGNTGNCNTGNWNIGDNNAGSKNTGSGNTGDNNTGNSNTGYFNTGYRNTGNRNTGSSNTGSSNTGYSNTGSSNTGNRNTGDFNTCNNSSGFFCTQEPKAIIFNMESDMTVAEFVRSKYYRALMSAPFVLVECKNDEVLKHTYKDACAKWWAKMTPENREVVKSIPNFEAEIFEEITGIKV